MKIAINWAMLATLNVIFILVSDVDLTACLEGYFLFIKMSHHFDDQQILFHKVLKVGYFQTTIYSSAFIKRQHGSLSSYTKCVKVVNTD